MNASEIVKKAMKADGITQKELAAALDLSSQQSIGNMLARRNGMRIDNFVKMMDKMGYEIVVRKKLGLSDEWKVEL